MSRTEKLLSFDFIAICVVIFLAYCNITVFYSLYLYLEAIGIPQEWRGFLIGSTSLSTIALFLSASPYLTVRNAAGAATLGVLILIGCGAAYLFVASVPGILAIRLANGVAVYLLSAACMTMMVARIPPAQSGRAFGFYSVALLLPYSIVPVVFDAVAPYLASPAHGYCGMSLLLLPGLALIALIARRRGGQAAAAAPKPLSLRAMYVNIAEAPIALVLGLNTIYIVTFSSLFFMAEGLFQSRGFANVGYFFTIQMFCMIGIRVVGNRIFDQIAKVKLVRFSFLMSALSFVLAAGSHGLWGLYGASLLLGIGMGVSSPALYGLMFNISAPQFKSVNSNLMMLSLQIGNFLGPLMGAWVMHVLGYNGLLLTDAATSLLGVALCFVLTSHAVDPEGLAVRA